MTEGHEIEALIRDQDKISEEIREALEDIPKHDALGLEDEKWMRVISAINNHRNLNIRRSKTYKMSWRPPSAIFRELKARTDDHP